MLSRRQLTCRWVSPSTAAGAAARAPRKADPRMDMRCRVPVMYSAVARPADQKEAKFKHRQPAQELKPVK